MSGVYLLLNITRTSIITYTFYIIQHFHGSKGVYYPFTIECCCETVIAILKTELLKTVVSINIRYLLSILTTELWQIIIVPTVDLPYSY